MADKNPILSSTNQPVEVPNLFAPVGVTRNSLAGLPLSSVDGEVAVKVDIIGAAATIDPTNLATSAKQDIQITAEQAILASLTGSLLPYSADEQDLTYYGSTNNIETIIYKKSGVTVKIRTFTYVGGGASSDDLLLQTLDT